MTGKSGKLVYSVHGNNCCNEPGQFLCHECLQKWNKLFLKLNSSMFELELKMLLLRVSYRNCFEEKFKNCLLKNMYVRQKKKLNEILTYLESNKCKHWNFVVILHTSWVIGISGFWAAILNFWLPLALCIIAILR